MSSAKADYVVGVASAGNPPAAVLLDAGGVFVLPDSDRIIGAFARAECSGRRDLLTDAHYRAAVRFGTHVDAEANWSEAWLDYLQTYVAECGVPPDWREEAHFHIDSEFADATDAWRTRPTVVARALRVCACALPGSHHLRWTAAAVAFAGVGQAGTACGR